MNVNIFISKWQRFIFLNRKGSRLIVSHRRNLSRKTQQSFQLASSSSPDIGQQQCLPARRVKVGIVFDIDGVLLRGRNVIPTAQKAIHKLKDSNIPFIYLTNGGCETEEQKAEKLKERLGVEVLLFYGSSHRDDVSKYLFFFSRNNLLQFSRRVYLFMSFFSRMVCLHCSSNGHVFPGGSMTVMFFDQK